jgi:hypothetical protein
MGESPKSVGSRSAPNRTGDRLERAWVSAPCSGQQPCGTDRRTGTSPRARSGKVQGDGKATGVGNGESGSGNGGGGPKGASALKATKGRGSGKARVDVAASQLAALSVDAIEFVPEVRSCGWAAQLHGVRGMSG